MLLFFDNLRGKHGSHALLEDVAQLRSFDLEVWRDGPGKPNQIRIQQRIANCDSSQIGHTTDLTKVIVSNRDFQIQIEPAVQRVLSRGVPIMPPNWTQWVGSIQDLTEF